MAKPFHCTIVTPAEAIFDGNITYASIPSWDGQQGIMAGESPVLTKLGIGTLRIDVPDEQSRYFMVDGGFAQIAGDSLTLLTEGATESNKLSAEEVNAELAEAAARVTKSGEDQEKVERDQQRAYAKRQTLRASGA